MFRDRYGRPGKVEGYLDAFYRGDVEAAGKRLADRLSVEGPTTTFDGAVAFLKAAAHVAAGVSAIRVHKIFVDGPHACAFYDLEVTHPVGRIQVAERYELDGDKIIAIRTIFDMARFAPRARNDAKDVVIDLLSR